MRQQAAFRGEEQRRARVVAELRTARFTGIQVALTHDYERFEDLVGKGERSG